MSATGEEVLPGGRSKARLNPPVCLLLVVGFVGVNIAARAQTAVYYSVGTSNPADLKNGTPTLTISIGTATLSVAQPDTIGVGDEITYNGSTKAYISGRTSSTVYSVTTATGAAPPDVGVPVAVNSITRAFNSLTAAEAGSGNGVHLGTFDLTSGGGFQLNWPVYNDNDTPMNEGQIVVNGYTTGPANYIRIFTPVGSSEVGTSQRHTGVAGTGFRLAPVADAQAISPYNFIQISDEYVRVEGIEIDGSGITNGSRVQAVNVYQSTGFGPSDVRISHNIIHDLANSNFNPASASDVAAIILGDGTVTVSNNVIYDIENKNSNTSSDAFGLHAWDTDVTAYAYNNTLLNIKNTASDNQAIGINAYTSTVTAKNNFVGDVGSTLGSESCYSAFGGTLNQNNNVSSDDTAVGAINQTAYATYFRSITNGTENLHLLYDSNILWGLYGDPSVPVIDDIDGDPRNATNPDIGADESCRPTINYRSIGTETNPLADTGSATVNLNDTVVTFTGVTLPTRIGQGDRIWLNTGGINEERFILSRDSDTQVTLQNPAQNDHSAGVPYRIERAFNTLQAWETAQDGDLVTEDRREVGVAYNDGPFTTGVIIQDSTTDSCHFMWLTVAEGQRHAGVAGTGARIDAGNVVGGLIRVRDSYTIVEWLEITRTRPDLAGVRVIETIGNPPGTVNNVLLSNLLVHDNADGVRIGGDGNNSFTIRNSIIYGNDGRGIHGDQATDTITVENCTVFGNGGEGVNENTTSFTVRNTISMNNGVDFNLPTGTQSYNISSDATAPCGTCLPNRTATANGNPGAGSWVIFNSITAGTEDFHLQDNAANDAIDAGDDLSSSFWNDIDGESRLGVSWDIGADEAGAQMAVVTGSYTGTGVAGLQITGLGFRPAFVIIKADYAYNGVMRSFTMNGTKDVWALTAPGANLITSLDTDGFTVGSDNRVNALNTCGAGMDPCVYYWTAFKAGADLKVGTYTGNGTLAADTQAITGLGFSPEYVIIISGAGNRWARNRTHFGGQNSTRLRNAGLTTDTIPSLDADGFRVQRGADDQESSNVSGETYHYIAFNEVAGKVKVGEYAGNGSDNRDITGVGFQPEYVILQSENDGDQAVTRSDKMVGDASLDFLGALTANQIQALLADGFQVGNDARVNQNNTPTEYFAYVAFDAEPVTTAVKLISFTADGFDRSVLLSWETATELDNLGFHLYRAGSEQGRYERVTSRLIPGLGSSGRGARYSYMDSGLTNGVRYFYKLEDVETTGKSELHGPVSATPSAGAIYGSDTESGTDGSSGEVSRARIVYGDPADNRIDVVRRGGGEVVFDLVTQGFYATALEDGAVLLEVPGLAEPAEGSEAAIPVYRSWVEAVAGRSVEVVSVRAEDVEVFSSLRPSGAGVSELAVSRDGTARVNHRRLRRGRAMDLQGVYPAEPARVLSIAFQGEVKKALVELAPLRWDAVSGELLLARRLVVRVAFEGREASERSVDGGRGRRPSRRRASGTEREVVARLTTVERGLYGARHESIFTSKRSLSTAGLRLSRQGRTVPFHVEPDRLTFGPGSTLYFVSEGAQANPYGQQAVYELELGGGGVGMAEASAAPSGEGVSYYWKRLEQEKNQFYQAALVEAPDVWLWDAVFAPESKHYPFEVSGLAQVSESGRLELWLQGTSDLPEKPDHHVRVRVNGTLVVEASWDGKKARYLEGELGAGLLREGENRLEIENVGDTGAAYSMVMVDRFAVSYPRLVVAEGQVLEGRFSRSGMAVISGLGQESFVLDVTEANRPRWMQAARAAWSGLAFRAEAERSYLVVAARAVRSPEVETPRTSSLRNRRNEADYIAIGPDDLLDAAAALLELRRSQGLRTMAVPIDEVFSEFGYGESNPRAIRDFLEYAYQNWQSPLVRYVLLLGDATYDFKDNLKAGVTNQVPPMMVKTSFLWTASDPTLAAVNGEDILPDVAIGRLPAQTREELRLMVAKILAYEGGETAPGSPVVLVADNPDDAGDFVADAEEIAESLPAGLEVRKIYLSALGTAATRAAILDAFNRGALLLSYVGHGGIHLWANENLLNINQVGALAAQPQQPLLLTMNCLNGYFHFPYFNSLAEELLKADGKGVVAAFSPSGLSLNASAHVYHKAVLNELFYGRHRRLGDAILAGQARYVQEEVFTELLTIYHLLGDPAMTLR